MLRRQDIVFLIGALTVAIGGALYLNPFHNEPLSIEWMLGPALVYFGLPVAIIGVAIHIYGPSAKSAASKNAPTVMKAQR